MSTVLYPSPIFGPIHSRRLGLSLGINLMPADGKICTFDCIYCECGFNSQHHPRLHRPTRQEVHDALQIQLQKMAIKGLCPDVLTFAGNGEPTAHPDFPAIIDDTIHLRNALCPATRISVLSNSTMILRPKVHATLMRVDNNIMKLDTISPEYITRIDRPTGHYDVERIIEGLKGFKGHVIIQTMFMKGFDENGQSVDNTGDDYVGPWIRALQRIKPQSVMVYTIDRETPDHALQKASHEELDTIVTRLGNLGINATAAY